MPNKPRADNPSRDVRVEDELWQAAKKRAAELTASGCKTTVSGVIREALQAFVENA